MEQCAKVSTRANLCQSVPNLGAENHRKKWGAVYAVIFLEAVSASI